MNTSGNCEVCGTLFARQSSGGYRKRFCSRKCSSASSNAKWNGVAKDRRRSARVADGACKYCAKPFAHPLRGRRRIFCSEACTQNQWALDHPDVIKARRQSNYANPAYRDRIKKSASEWQKANPERARTKKNAWAKTEKGKLLGKSTFHRRRARKLNAGGSFTRTEFKALCTATGNRCLCCGQAVGLAKLTADHIVALVAGGHNGIGNIQPLCMPCNKAKGTETMNYLIAYALENVVIHDPAQYAPQLTAATGV